MTGFALLSLYPCVARADQQACFDAAVKGQELRKTGKLSEARAAFVVCAGEECPAEVSGRCTSWIAEVDEAIPSVFVVTQDAAGHELSHVVVRVDGAPREIGQAISLMPGTHTFVLESAEGHALETITLRERERGRQVVLRLPERRAEPLPPSDEPGRSALPWVFASIGLASAASFGAFAIAGFVDRGQSHCDVGCGSADASRVRAELLVADISLGAAVVFGTIALIDWLVVRKSKHATHVGLWPGQIVF